MILLSADGHWQVEAIRLDRGKGVEDVLRVRARSLKGWVVQSDGGYVTTPAEVERIMGADAYATLGAPS